MKVLLICGYRRTGKDSLCHALLGKKSPYKWQVYAHPRSDKELDFNAKVKRSAFADRLKLDVSDVYGIPYDIPDEMKDLKQFYIDGVLCSARDLYISHATSIRAEDEDYWVKLVIDDAENLDTDLIITDWRFENEVMYTVKKCEVVTARVFRAKVPVPDATIESEHKLDDFRTDFLLVPSEEDFEAALEIFPQYDSYTHIGDI